MLKMEPLGYVLLPNGPIVPFSSRTSYLQVGPDTIWHRLRIIRGHLSGDSLSEHHSLTSDLTLTAHLRQHSVLGALARHDSRLGSLGWVAGQKGDRDTFSPNALSLADPCLTPWCQAALAATGQTRNIC